MLVDGVKELDEWNDGEGDNLGFKEMVICIANEKGDNGKVAFLESVGLPLSSAMGVAHYLTSESLPSIIQKVGAAYEDIGKMLLKYPWILSTSIQENYEQILLFSEEEKVVLFFKALGLDQEKFGISRDYFPIVIKKYPELLVSDMGKTPLPRMNYLMEMGLSRREISLMVCRFSPLLGYSIEEVLKPKLEFLLNGIGKPVKDVVGYPRFFSYSPEKRIKPRFWVLKGRNIECSLEEMLGKNDQEFAVEFMGMSSAT
ncbi:hypothetical protein F3Y22_tig00117021pilonHSYRG00204 [Hibiscus syriacus]|uniref:Mitochondrial transcription termination factor family protein n=1 Tax=Hibiscus syriacus TaxID=106335 RepID=A0A6A2WC70_HIBSY|nr:hypothetical protein F3Y22_tig00117021pilonHSYRG00204 [Hibiscus syriacus]